MARLWETLITLAWLAAAAPLTAQAQTQQQQPAQKAALRDQLIADVDATDADKIDFVIRPLKADLSVSAITGIGFSRTADGVIRPQSTNGVTITPCPEVKAGKGILKLGRSCPVTVSLTAPGGPGRYTAKIEVLASDERELVSIAFDHTRPWYFAFGVLAFGLAIGAYVGNWLNVGRDLALKAIAVKRARADIEAAAKGTPLLTDLASTLIGRSEEMEREINAIDDAELDELRLRPAQLRFIAEIDRDATHIGGDRTALDAALRTLMDALAPDSDGKLQPGPATSVQAVRASLEAMLKAARGNIESAARSVEPPSQAYPVDLSAERAEQKFKRREWITATILALIFAAMTLVTSYFKVPVWGTPSDFLTMFLIGFGAYAGSIASVSAFLKRSTASPF